MCKTWSWKWFQICLYIVSHGKKLILGLSCDIPFTLSRINCIKGSDICSYWQRMIHTFLEELQNYVIRTYLFLPNFHLGRWQSWSVVFFYEVNFDWPGCITSCVLVSVRWNFHFWVAESCVSCTSEFQKKVHEIYQIHSVLWKMIYWSK